jgi:putative sugar O-methyltransferase
VIERDNPHILDEFLEVARANDRLGSPATFDYPGVGSIAPTTLRYLKVLSDLERLFGDLTGMRVVEIGVGYGGQCSLVVQRWRLSSYVLVDLEPPLALARRYLETLGVADSVVFTPPNALQTSDYDLCVSNYAFSELARDVQDEYARLAVSLSSRGYMTINFISRLHGIDSRARGELTELHSGAHWLPEEPVTYGGNGILVWGDRGVVKPRGHMTHPPA